MTHVSAGPGAGGGRAEIEHGAHHETGKELKQVLARGMALGHPKPCCQTAEGAWHGDHTVGLGDLPPGSATSEVLFLRALFFTFNGGHLLGTELGFSCCWHYWLARRLLWKIADSKLSRCFFLLLSAPKELCSGGKWPGFILKHQQPTFSRLLLLPEINRTQIYMPIRIYSCGCAFLCREV